MRLIRTVALLLLPLWTLACHAPESGEGPAATSEELASATSSIEGVWTLNNDEAVEMALANLSADEVEESGEFFEELLGDMQAVVEFASEGALTLTINGEERSGTWEVTDIEEEVYSVTMTLVETDDADEESKVLHVELVGESSAHIDIGDDPLPFNRL